MAVPEPRRREGTVDDARGSCSEPKRASTVTDICDAVTTNGDRFGTRRETVSGPDRADDYEVCRT